MRLPFRFSNHRGAGKIQMVKKRGPKSGPLICSLERSSISVSNLNIPKQHGIQQRLRPVSVPSSCTPTSSHSMDNTAPINLFALWLCKSSACWQHLNEHPHTCSSISAASSRSSILTQQHPLNILTQQHLRSVLTQQHLRSILTQQHLRSIPTQQHLRSILTQQHLRSILTQQHLRSILTQQHPLNILTPSPSAASYRPHPLLTHQRETKHQRCFWEKTAAIDTFNEFSLENCKIV